MTDCIICILLVVDLGLDRVKDDQGGGCSKGAERTKADNEQKKKKGK